MAVLVVVAHVSLELVGGVDGGLGRLDLYCDAGSGLGKGCGGLAVASFGVDGAGALAVFAFGSVDGGLGVVWSGNLIGAVFPFVRVLTVEGLVLEVDLSRGVSLEGFSVAELRMDDTVSLRC